MANHRVFDFHLNMLIQENMHPDHSDSEQAKYLFYEIDDPQVKWKLYKELILEAAALTRKELSQSPPMSIKHKVDLALRSH